MEHPKVRIRADGNSRIGLGHLFRAVALAEGLKPVFETYIIVQNLEKRLLDSLLQRGINIENLDQFDLDSINSISSFANKITSNDIVILDGYRFDSKFQEAVKRNYDCKLVYIDDLVDKPIVADLVINHAGGINQSRYNLNQKTSLLLGPAYAILQQAFLQSSKRTERPEKIKNLLISFGGADPGNKTQAVLEKVIGAGFKGIINVIVGSAYSHFEQLNILTGGNERIKIFRAISPEQLVEIMAFSDCAICSSSTIAYEYACVSGLLFIEQTADNQAHLYQYLLDSNLALPISRFFELHKNSEESSAKRDQMMHEQQVIFDGKSTLRIRNAITKLFICGNILVRKAELGDLDTYFSWANDPLVRQNSFSVDPVTYEKHVDWFHQNLNDHSSVMYVLTTKDNFPVASIRFKIDGVTAILSYLIDNLFRGVGLSREVLRLGVEKLFDDHSAIIQIVGFVKGENFPSISAFLANGFLETESLDKANKHFYKTR